MLRLFCLSLIWLLFYSGNFPHPGKESFNEYLSQFNKGYRELNIPPFQYEYTGYFLSVPDTMNLISQRNFFKQQYHRLIQFKESKLSIPHRLAYDRLDYEIDFNLQRIRLEMDWVRSGRKIPEQGYLDSTAFPGWYSFFVQKFTGLTLTPTQLFQFGQTEVNRLNALIDSVQTVLKYHSRAEMSYHLKNDSFYFHREEDVVQTFERIDRDVKKHLGLFCTQTDVAPVYPVQWSGADAHTPPGIYLNRTQNAYGKDVFMYNFYGSKFLKRAAAWLYLHEAVPGHHLQAHIRNTLYKHNAEEPFNYPGTFEGWACYAENEGRILNVYNQPEDLLGLYEWNLIRAVRVVLDAGIHYSGWTKEEALAYWKKNITGFDDLAQREINRVINWPAQALSYQVGASFLRNMFSELRTQNKCNYAKLHTAFLHCGQQPLPVIRKNLLNVYEHL